jgi:LacI family gluconate utilization system Gnt-I transcriptional repressor
MNRAVRVEDVAREAGVSPITVSRALSSPHKVKPETRQRVMEAVARTGYVVNSIASSLRSGRSSIVTVFVASLQNPHFATAVQGALEAFEGSRFHLMFAQTGYSQPLGAEIVETVKPFRPAGVMFTGVVLGDEAREAMRRFGVPVVEVWGEPSKAIDIVAGASIFEGTRMMGEHFAEQGYRRVAYCGQTHMPGGIGLDGFRQGYEAEGRKLAYVLAKEGTGTLARGISSLDEILAAVPDCDAIFFGSDLLACGAMIRGRDRGIDIPGQIAIGGYGDLEFASHLNPPLTTLHASDYETGKLAGKGLRQRLEGGPASDPVIQVPMRLVVRASTPRK